MLAKDLKDFLCAFNTHKVEYLVVGSYAVGVYSQPRATKDLDVLIRVSEENGKAVFRALADFGASLEGISPSDFSDDPSSAFQIGQVTHAYLLGVAVREGLVLVTVDKAIRYLAGSEHSKHVLLLKSEAS